MTWRTRPTDFSAVAAGTAADRTCSARALSAAADRPAGLPVASAFLAMMSTFPFLRLERLGARDDFDEFLGDLRLALAIVAERQPVDHVAGIARGIVHGAHPCALLRCSVLQES